MFLTENSPAMSLVDNAGLFTPVSQETLDLIPPQYVPSDQNWTGFIARSTVLVYNDAVSEDELPASLMDLAERVGQPGGVLADRGGLPGDRERSCRHRGRGSRRRVDPGLADNGTVLENNLVVMEAVNAGEVDTGIIYHYYWYRDQKEAGENSDSSQLHFFGNRDPGAFLSVSGAGVLASSEKQEDSQRFVNFLASTEAAGHRRLLRAGVPAEPGGLPRPAGQALRRTPAAADRRLDPQQRSGDRHDAGRGAPLSTSVPTLKQALEARRAGRTGRP